MRSIATYVGSRNPTQVRTHAQKYFLRKQREASKGLIASRKRSMSESDLARVDRLHAATAATPPPSPPPRFPLPKPPLTPNSSSASSTMNLSVNANNTAGNSKIDGQEAALLLQLADARENAVRYKCALENKEIECEDLRSDLERLPPPSAITQPIASTRRQFPSELPPPRPPRQSKMEIDP